MKTIIVQTQINGDKSCETVRQKLVLPMTQNEIAIKRK
jgi:hypothetical protein